MASEPSAEYQSRLAHWRDRLGALSTLDARLAAARLVVFGAAAVLAYALWQTSWSGWWLLVPGAIFVALAVRHDRVMRARDRSASLVTFYERGLARIEDRWPGTGATGERYRNDYHPYANDLDLFGPGSLFELLSL